LECKFCETSAQVLGAKSDRFLSAH